MEKPILNWLNDKSIDFPFCLCWANENWSKLWDGGNKEVLMKQELKPDDDEKFAKDILPFFKDERYIRINNKPLFVVYRPKLFSQERFCKFIDNIKSECKKNGIDDLFILISNSFDFEENPKEWNADAIVEFPPNFIHAKTIYKQLINNSKVTIYDFADFAKQKQYMRKIKYKTFKCVFPGWDNTARKAYSGASCFLGCTPDVYQTWLEDCINYTKLNHKPDERFVFINAWNEWAEGAHLEPDRYYGYSYLNATKKALINTSQTKKIIYVGHDACYNGAQILSLNIIKELSEKLNYNIEMLLLSGGPLEEEYKKYAYVTLLNKYNKEQISEKISNLKKNGYLSAICNTSVVGNIVKLLHENEIRCISLIHELPKLIKNYHLEGSILKISKYADKIIFASSVVEKGFTSLVKTDNSKIIIRPQGLYKINKYKNNKEEAKKCIREQLNIPQNSKIILFVGYADKRKGIDLYLNVAQKLIEKNKNYYFVIVGDIETEMLNSNLRFFNDKKYKDFIIRVGKQYDTSLYYAGSDLYLLTSREDPFPSVVLEAFDVGLPVIGFENAGGFADIINKSTGKLVKYENTQDMANAVEEILENKDLITSINKNTQFLIEQDYSWSDYVKTLVNTVQNKG